MPNFLLTRIRRPESQTAREFVPKFIEVDQVLHGCGQIGRMHAEDVARCIGQDRLVSAHVQCQ